MSTMTPEPTPTATDTATPTPEATVTVTETVTASPDPACGNSTASACWVQPTEASLDSVLYPVVIGLALTLLFLAAMVASQLRRP